MEGALLDIPKGVEAMKKQRLKKGGMEAVAQKERGHQGVASRLDGFGPAMSRHL